MFQKLLKNVARALRQQHIPYMIIGGQAVLLYGEPRLTKDIDITLGIGIDRWKIIEKIAKSIHLKSLVTEIEDFVKDTFVFPAIDDKAGFGSILYSLTRLTSARLLNEQGEYISVKRKSSSPPWKMLLFIR